MTAIGIPECLEEIAVHSENLKGRDCLGDGRVTLQLILRK
jgi:hypothetical protein